MNKKVVLLMSGLFILIFFAGISDAKPNLTVSPTSGYRGTPVTISGSGWIPNEQVSIFWNGVSPRIISVDGDGNFSLGWEVPEAGGIFSVGRIDLFAIGKNEWAVTYFTIVPGFIWVEPRSGLPGTEIEIYGKHFWDSSGHDDSAFFDGTYLGLVYHVGNVIKPYSHLHMKIPEDASMGYHEICIREQFNENACTRFYVTTDVPEYPTIALPLISLIGLVFILHRHQIKK